MAAHDYHGAPGPAGGERVGADRNKVLRRVLTYVLLVLIALVFLLPLGWMVSTSLKPKSQLVSARNILLDSEDDHAGQLQDATGQPGHTDRSLVLATA